MGRQRQFATPETLERMRSESGRQLAERALAADGAGDELATTDYAFRALSVLAGGGDPGCSLPQERTKPGARCEVCGKPLSRSLLRHAPWATTCNQPCFMTQVLRSMPAWQVEADRARAGGDGEGAVAAAQPAEAPA